MKVKLLNNGGFNFLIGVKFPIEVEAVSDDSGEVSVTVKSNDLVSIGAGKMVYSLPEWTFIIGEFEVIK